jgi:hypothetical protein
MFPSSRAGSSPIKAPRIRPNNYIVPCPEKDGAEDDFPQCEMTASTTVVD